MKFEGSSKRCLFVGQSQGRARVCNNVDLSVSFPPAVESARHRMDRLFE